MTDSMIAHNDSLIALRAVKSRVFNQTCSVTEDMANFWILRPASLADVTLSSR